MTCIAELINPNNNKSIKTKYVYGSMEECENKVIALNEKIKSDRFWRITTINV